MGPAAGMANTCVPGGGRANTVSGDKHRRRRRPDVSGSPLEQTSHDRAGVPKVCAGRRSRGRRRRCRERRRRRCRRRGHTPRGCRPTPSFRAPEASNWLPAPRPDVAASGRRRGSGIGHSAAAETVAVSARSPLVLSRTLSPLSLALFFHSFFALHIILLPLSLFVFLRPTRTCV